MTVSEIAFSHIALSVADLDKSSSFYALALGFVEGQAYSAAGRRIAGFMECQPDGFEGRFLRLGPVLLELLAYRTSVGADERPRLPYRVGIAHLSFLVQDMEAVRRNVVINGGSWHGYLENDFGAGATARIGFCLDPDGNRIELQQHDTDEAVGPHAAFLGLDKLGWPGVDVLR
jgi:catechol 2,3-dioxygenase-like lactoylglutathione lyase family enzyme